MFADLAALSYLEWRQFINRLRSIARRPGRALLYAAAIAYFVFVAVYRAHSGGFSRPFLPEPYADAIFYAYVVLLGVLAYGAASGIAGTFSSSADARFLTGSHISERLIVVWLQLRRSALTVFRMVFTIVLYAVVFSRSGTLTGIGLALTGGALVATGIAVPMLKIRAIAGARTAQSIAAAVAAAGLLPLSIVISSLISARTATSARGVESLGAGFAANALLAGRPPAVAGLFAFAALLLALSFTFGTGLFADLYSASMKALEYRQRSRRGSGAVFAMEYAYRGRKVDSLQFLFARARGAWAIAWKEWIAFVRSPSMQRLFGLGAAACIAVGAIAGHIAAESRDPAAELFAICTVAGQLIVIFVAMGSAIGLAADLRKPLWWIGPDPLWLRLVAWMAGTSWRFAICLSCGIIACAASMHSAAVAAAGVPSAVACVLYLRAVGLLLYSLFPSTIDQRGPLSAVRALLTYLLAMPPLIAGGVALALGRPAAEAVGLAIAISVFETALLVAGAASRIAGQGVAFADAQAL